MPASVTADQLDPAARAELRTLPADLAEAVARYLVAAAQAEDAERGYEYALAARRLAARVGIVRETKQGLYWMDVVAYDIDLRRRFKRVRIVLLALVLLLLAGLSFSLFVR